MAISSKTAFEASGREIILTLNNKKPISADDLGALFTAMANDYRRVTRGRTLVVGRVETGSLIAILWDQVAPYAHNAVEVLHAVKGVTDFTKTLMDAYANAKKGEARIRAVLGDRSIGAIIKVAAESQCEVDLRYTAPGRQDLRLRVKPLDAIQMQAKQQARLTDKSKKARLRIKGPARQLLLSRMTDVAGSLADLPAKLAGSDRERAKALIAAFVAAFSANDLKYHLETLAHELEQAGRRDVAVMVRAQL